MIYILYNPNSGDKHAKEKAEILQLKEKYEAMSINITEIEDYNAFLSPLDETDTLIICGGDGTLNRFINNTKDIKIIPDILYFPVGSGNDFAHDMSHETNDMPFRIKHLLKNLPTVEVKGKTYYFLNNVGFGIDGYCCEQGDIKKQISDNSVNYTTIALKGLIYDFKPRNATVTVDGESTEYQRVWMAPTLKGRFFGGGMMATPDQNRCDPEKKLSILIVHNANKIKLLTLFPLIFTGKHITHTDVVEIKTGHEISVTFDVPTQLQIDGETILDVTTYTVKA